MNEKTNILSEKTKNEIAKAMLEMILDLEKSQENKGEIDIKNLIPKEHIEKEIELTKMILKEIEIMFDDMSNKLDYDDLQKVEKLIARLSLEMIQFAIKVI